jgi:hypothetical protein
VTDDLREDRLTAWVPDVMAYVDDTVVANDPKVWEAKSVAWPVRIPKFGGGEIRAWNLTPTIHRLLYESVAGLRDLVDGVLAPGVCGYRRGADASRYYADEYRRFQEFTAGESESAAYVVFADVQRFFEHLPLRFIADEVDKIAGQAVAAPLRHILGILASVGVATLPAGYADMRMLANLFLAGVDKQVPVSFTRWVDDYRLFVPQGADPVDAVRASV